MQDIVFGKERVRKWPRKKPKRPTPAEKRTRDKFRTMQRATKYFAPRLYLDMMKMVEGTPLLPRDVMTMMLSGRLFAFVTEDGKVRWPMPARLDVSDALDAISNKLGQILVRGQQGWEGREIPSLAIKAALARITSTFFLPSGAYHPVPFDEVEYDDLGFWSEDQPTRFTIPPSIGRIKATAWGEFTPSSGTAILAIRKNGDILGPDPAGYPKSASDTGIAEYVTTATALVEVEEGDYIELFAYSTSGADLRYGWLGIEAL